MKFRLQYQGLVATEDIPRISPDWQKKIKKAVEEKLTSNPQIYGKPLRQSLKGFRKLRVGDYRVIFKIEGLTVKIFAIQHRSVVYRRIIKRV
ncbi:MAG: type II toxin-antitoxin system RelE/ParE family toxin [Patescibacteria group bacterium]